MITDREWKVGETLWFVPDRHGGGFEVTIVAVGRKWLTLDCKHGKCDRQTLALQEPFGNRVYPSKEEYESTRWRRIAWDRLSAAVRNQYGPPDGLTTEAIQEAMKLLGFDGATE